MWNIFGNKEKSNKDISKEKLANMTHDEFADYLLDDIPKKRSVTSEFKKYKISATVEHEFNRRKQILEESIKLIQTTNSIETLSLRYLEAIEHSSWIKEQISLGANLYFKEEPDGFNESLNRISNFHIHRLVQYNYKKQMSRINELKSQNAIIENKRKLIELLEKCKSCMKYHENKYEFEMKINILIKSIN